MNKLKITIFILFAYITNVYPISDTLNIQLFGAKGNGIQDDREAIQNALNRLRPNQTLIFPKTDAFYKVINVPLLSGNVVSQRKKAVSEDKIYPLVCNQKDITIIFEGDVKATSILSNLFEFNGSNTIIRGNKGRLSGPCGNDDSGYLDTNSWDETLQWHPSLLVVKGNNSKIENLILENPPTCGITVKGNNCTVDGCTIIGGRVLHSDTGTALFGVFLDYGSDYSTVVNCSTTKNKQKGSIYSGVFSVSSNNKIISNTFYDYHEHGVYNYGDNISILNNTFLSEYALAADIQNFANGGIIKNNKSINTRAFLLVMKGANSQVIANKCVNVNGGIFFRQYPGTVQIVNNVQIKQNEIQLNNKINSSINGIDLDIIAPEKIKISNIIVENNTIEGVASPNYLNAVGINIAVSDNGSQIDKSSFSGNVVRNYVGTPVLLSNVTNSKVENNNFINIFSQNKNVVSIKLVNVTKTNFRNNKHTDSNKTYYILSNNDSKNNKFRKNSLKEKR